MLAIDRNCSLIFDEISLSEHLTFDRANDKVVGYVDLGPLGRKNEIANHALVFMVNGLHKSWKQPIAFFFTKDCIKSSELKSLIEYVIIKLEGAGLRILCTVCDQAATNRAAITLLSKNIVERGPYFLINNHKVFTIFDPPHLLKSTRNALIKYNIQYNITKTAKIEHIRHCFQIDQKKRFQSLRRIREEYLYLTNNSRLKMKVSIASRTLTE